MGWMKTYPREARGGNDLRRETTSSSMSTLGEDSYKTFRSEMAREQSREFSIKILVAFSLFLVFWIVSGFLEGGVLSLMWFGPRWERWCSTLPSVSWHSVAGGGPTDATSSQTGRSSKLFTVRCSPVLRATRADDLPPAAVCYIFFSSAYFQRYRVPRSATNTTLSQPSATVTSRPRARTLPFGSFARSLLTWWFALSARVEGFLSPGRS